MSNSKPNSNLPPDIAAELLAACRAGALRAGWALSRALDIPVRLVIRESTNLAAWRTQLPANQRALQGPGLMVLMPTGGAAVLLVSASNDVLPEWVFMADGLQQGRLAAMAQELGTALLPRRLVARDCAAAGILNLAAALACGRCAADAVCISMSLTLADGPAAPALLIWPLEQPAAVFERAEPVFVERLRQPASADCRAELRRVNVPVKVVLAQTRLAVQRIVELAPGSILRFGKSYQAPLELQVDGRRLVTGHCVEIGRRLGLVISSR
ncbi:MAG: FliM/FliN family flagellar motor switch protein [Pirellulales bacterium]